MLDIGWSELLVIAIVMIVVVGPKDLPKMLRAFGKATSRMRATANEFRNQFNEALKEAELDDVKNVIDETRKLDPRSKLTQVFDPIRSAGEDLRAGLQSGTSMSPASEKPAAVTTPVEADGAPAAPAAPVAAPAAEPAPPVVKTSPAKADAKPRKAPARAKKAADGPKAAPARPAAQKTATQKTAAKKNAAKKPAAKAGARASKTGNEA